MAYHEKQMLRDGYGHIIPQYYDPIEDVFKPLTSGVNVVEQLTETNAVTGNVTFAANVSTLEIFNTDEVNEGIFTVNGINITVPAGKIFKASYKGTPSNIVAVSGSTSYILTRYE